MPVALAGLGGLILFALAGNATRGYIDSPSLFTWWFSQWFDPQAETGHGPLVLAVAAWLAWRNRGASRCASVSRPAMGAGVCAGALVLHALGYLVQQTRISAVAFLLFCWGLAWLAGGRRAARATAFPLTFLLFALPLGFVMDRVGFPLRLAVGSVSAGLAGVLGVDILREGTQLTSPDGRFAYDVAPACSGIRSLTALTALGVLLGYVAFRSWWRRGVLALAALPLAFAGNVARILAIVLAGAWFGQGAGRRVHDGSGFVTFAVALGLAMLLVELIRRRWPERDAPAAVPAPLPSPTLRARWLAGAGVLALALAVALLASRLDTLGRSGAPGIRVDAAGQPLPLPANLGYEWMGSPIAVSAAERAVLPDDTGFARRLYHGFGGTEVMLSAVLSGRDRSSIHRPEVCLPGQGWSVRTSRVTHLELDDGQRLPLTVLSLEKEGPGGRPLTALFAYWFVSEDSVTATHFGRMRHDIAARLSGRSPRWAYVIAQTPSPDGDQAALSRIHDVIRRALPHFQVTLPAPGGAGGDFE